MSLLFAILFLLLLWIFERSFNWYVNLFFCYSYGDYFTIFYFGLSDFSDSIFFSGQDFSMFVGKSISSTTAWGRWSASFTRTMQFHLTPLKCRVSPCMRKAAAVRLGEFWKQQTQHKLQTKPTCDSGKRNWLIKLTKTGWFSKKVTNWLSGVIFFWGGHTGEDDVCLLTENLRFNLCRHGGGFQALRDPRCLRFNRSFGLEDIGMSGGFSVLVGARRAPCKN